MKCAVNSDGRYGHGHRQCREQSGRKRVEKDRGTLLGREIEVCEQADPNVEFRGVATGETASRN